MIVSAFLNVEAIVQKLHTLLLSKTFFFLLILTWNMTQTCSWQALWDSLLNLSHSLSLYHCQHLYPSSFTSFSSLSQRGRQCSRWCVVGVMSLGRSSVRTQAFIRTLKRAEEICERTISGLRQLTNSSRVELGGMRLYMLW